MVWLFDSVRRGYGVCVYVGFAWVGEEGLGEGSDGEDFGVVYDRDRLAILICVVLEDKS